MPNDSSGRIFSLAQVPPPKLSGLALYSDGFWFANSTGTGWESGVKVTFVKATWHHIAIVKHEITWLFFIDGILKGHSVNEVAPFTGSNFRLGGTLYISGTGDPAAIDLYLDNFRFYDGISRWTENFTVPDEDDY